MNDKILGGLLVGALGMVFAAGAAAGYFIAQRIEMTITMHKIKKEQNAEEKTN